MLSGVWGQLCGRKLRLEGGIKILVGTQHYSSFLCLDQKCLCLFSSLHILLLLIIKKVSLDSLVMFEGSDCYCLFSSMHTLKFSVPRSEMVQR